MARLNKKRFCKVCGIEIDNSKRKIHKRTKFCSKVCVDKYNKDKRERKLNYEQT
jgi:RNA polymerase-binding transcription factor DksA